MNTVSSSARELATALVSAGSRDDDDVEVLICPPFPWLALVGECVAGSGIALGAQDAWFEPPGAFTGEVAVEMLLDLACSYVIIGHSERRHVLGETDAIINSKVHAAIKAGLRVILCVGELLEERKAGKTEAVLDSHLSGGLSGVGSESMRQVVIAYEPVWAIGTGVTATPEQAQTAHAHLRKRLAGEYDNGVGENARILYGGSVKAANAKSLIGQPDVDGALVGGASLKADEFSEIIEAGRQLAGN